jgi:nucleoside-diphosphate-sugar epimerase
MKTALIGYTGFIGKNLSENFNFTEKYNSKNIEEIKNKEFDMIISCGNSSLKWFVNQNSDYDLANIMNFIEIIKSVKAKKFILISTIDVYSNPIGVTETNPSDVDVNKPYGKNRKILEDFLLEKFEDILVIRLPIVYGKYFTKNLIFDGLNKRQLNKINPNSKVQIYNVENLLTDINYFIERKLKIVNLSTEPILVDELFKSVFEIELEQTNENLFISDMKSKFVDGGYFKNKKQVLSELKSFRDNYEIISF